MKREYKLFIQDINECIAQIEEFVGNMTLEKFLKMAGEVFK